MASPAVGGLRFWFFLLRRIPNPCFSA